MQKMLLGKKQLVSLGIAALIAMICAGATIFWYRKHVSSIVPSALVEKLLFPIYAPAHLPAGYTIDQKSFTIREGNILVFQALNSAGANIAITEEASPTGFNFSSFYQANLSNIRNLDGTRYTSVMGILESNDWSALSITTGTTWVLMTSKTHFDEATQRDIAQHLLRQ